MKDLLLAVLLLLFFEIINAIIIIPFFPEFLGGKFFLLLNISWIFLIIFGLKEFLFGFLQFGIDLNKKIDEFKNSFKNDQQ